MRTAFIFLAVFPMLMLSGCEKKFEQKFEDNLQELQSEADEIQAQADERLAAGLEADEATEQVDISEE